MLPIYIRFDRAVDDDVIMDGDGYRVWSSNESK